MEEVVTVLIADDEHLVRSGIRHLLSSQTEFKLVSEAIHGEDAVKKVQETNPDIVIMDVKMPVLNGLESTRNIKKIAPKTKVVILSGHDEFKFAQQALQNGASDYILKPTNLEALVETLRRVKAQISDEKNSERIFTESLSAYMEQFYEQLLFGEILPEELNERRSTFDLKPENARVCIVSVDHAFKLRTSLPVDEFEKLGLKLKEQIVKSLATNASSIIPVIRIDNKTCAVIVFDTVSDDPITFANELFESLNYPYPFTIALGKDEKLENLRDSLKDGILNLRQRIISGGNRVIYTVIETSDEKPGYPEIIEKELIRKIRFGDIDGTKKCLSELFSQLKNTNLSPWSWHEICFDIIEIGYRMLNELNIPIDSSDTLLRKSKEILELDSIDVMLIWLEKNIGNIIRQINTNISGPSIVIKKAELFIKENFNYNLTLSELANHVYLSPNYLSQLFKKETGKTFLEYLTSCRMGEAKKLLSQTTLNISEIANKIGYDNPRYFSELFHKNEKVTPTKYRKGIVS